MAELPNKKTRVSKYEETLISTFPRICNDSCKLTNKQFFLTDPVLRIAALKSFFSKDETYGLAKLAIEEFYDGEMLLIFTVKDAITIGSILLALEDNAIRENANKRVFDADGLDAFKEFCNQVCGMLDNELRPKLPKPVHLKLTTIHTINSSNVNTALSEDAINEECLILTAKMRILGFDDGQFTISLSKLIGEEFFCEAIEDENKKFKGTILAIDDSKLDLRIMKKFLSNEYQVMVAESANNALSMLQKHRIDLVLMDIYMPGVDGLTLCERIKRNAMSDDIPIIICSASPTQDNVVKAVRAGAVDFLVKPFTRQKLLEKISKHIKKNNLPFN